MTTRPTDEEIRDALYECAGTYQIKYLTELADALDHNIVERQAARDGVTDEMVEVACNGYNQALRDVGYNDEMDDGLSYASPMAMRAALQSIAAAQAVPDTVIAKMIADTFATPITNTINDLAKAIGSMFHA